MLPAHRVTQAGTAANCTRCDAICCRLTVVLAAEDAIPAHLRATTAQGVAVMARDADGWCAALDRGHMRCSLYAERPQGCRRFVMNGPYCRAVRADAHDRITRGIPLQLH